MGGRLVCFLPCLKESYSENMVPQHSALKLVANTEQRLQADASRRLLTYEKISDTGELVENDSLNNVDFREQFFSQLDRNRQKQERSAIIKQHNLEETAKRGITLPNIFEYKKNCNKKRLKESE
jgi:tRNA (guanine10-N2)-methyltransferase